MTDAPPDEQLPPGAAPPVQTGRKEKSRGSFLRELVLIVVIALALSFLVKTFLVQPFSIPSESMENTLDVGDRILVSKLTPQHSPLHRGDVIVFEAPPSWGEMGAESTGLKAVVKNGLEWVGILPAGGHHVVKRLIGLPGDHVVCDATCADSGGPLKINGVAINESSYLKPGNAPSGQKFDITVPANSVWVMGDNRGDSWDSRGHDNGTGKTGSVPMSDITGEVVAIAWPINRIQSVSSHPEVFAKVPAP